MCSICKHHLSSLFVYSIAPFITISMRLKKGCIICQMAADSLATDRALDPPSYSTEDAGERHILDTNSHLNPSPSPSPDPDPDRNPYPKCAPMSNPNPAVDPPSYSTEDAGEASGMVHVVL